MYEYEIQLSGPYQFYGVDVLFSQPVAREPGVYLFTVPYDNRFLANYVGETGQSFTERLTTHAQSYVSGLYRIYDPRSFVNGQKKLIWGGLWKAGTRDRMGDFLDRYEELSPVAYECLGLLRIFVAPIHADKRVRERIEARVVGELHKNPGVISDFVDDDLRCRPKREDEPPFTVSISGLDKILGLSVEVLIC
jgi:hypothetical protein